MSKNVKHHTVTLRYPSSSQLGTFTVSLRDCSTVRTS